MLNSGKSQAKWEELLTHTATDSKNSGQKCVCMCVKQMWKTVTFRGIWVTNFDTILAISLKSKIIVK